MRTETDCVHNLADRLPDCGRIAATESANGDFLDKVHNLADRLPECGQVAVLVHISISFMFEYVEIEKGDANCVD